MLTAGVRLAPTPTWVLIHDPSVLMQSNICRLRIPLAAVLWAQHRRCNAIISDLSIWVSITPINRTSVIPRDGELLLQKGLRTLSTCCYEFISMLIISVWFSFPSLPADFHKTSPYVVTGSVDQTVKVWECR